MQQAAREGTRAEVVERAIKFLPETISVDACYHGKNTIREIRRRCIIVGISGGITDETFPQEKKGMQEKVQLRFAEFEADTPIVDAFAAFDRYCVRPAGPVEVLSIGRKSFCDEPRNILALGQSLGNNGERYVYVFGPANDRDAHLHWGGTIPKGMLCAVVDLKKE